MLSNFPTDTSGQWTGMNLYRSVNDDPGDTNYYLVHSFPISGPPGDPAANPPVPVGSYQDNATDTQLQTADQVMSFTGPAASTTTPLKDVVIYNGTTYANAFPTTGTLQFTGTKDGNSLTMQSMQITNASTLKDLATFLQGSLGIQPPPGIDPNNAIPVDAGTGQAAGVTITSDGRIQIVSNDGTPNAATIGLSAMQLVSGNGASQTTAVSMPFNSIQTAKGDGTTADMVAYDSLGIPLSVRITTVLDKVTSSFTQYRWYADSGQNDPGGGQTNIAVGEGVIQFDGQGNLIPPSTGNTTVSIGRANEPSVKPLQFNLDFTQVSGLASNQSSLTVSRQDGSAPGVLSSFIISDNGLISGVFSNGISRDLGQIRLARFSNPVGLEQQGQNMYSAGVNSGLPIMGNPGDQGTGTIVSGSLELSNTDIGGSLINLITTQTMYSSNTRVITTAQQMFNELLQLLR